MHIASGYVFLTVLFSFFGIFTSTFIYFVKIEQKNDVKCRTKYKTFWVIVYFLKFINQIEQFIASRNSNSVEQKHTCIDTVSQYINSYVRIKKKGNFTDSISTQQFIFSTAKSELHNCANKSTRTDDIFLWTANREWWKIEQKRFCESKIKMLSVTNFRFPIAPPLAASPQSMLSNFHLIEF